jgi:hypothetical protein
VRWEQRTAGGAKSMTKARPVRTAATNAWTMWMSCTQFRGAVQTNGAANKETTKSINRHKQTDNLTIRQRNKAKKKERSKQTDKQTTNQTAPTTDSISDPRIRVWVPALAAA